MKILFLRSNQGINCKDRNACNLEDNIKIYITDIWSGLNWLVIGSNGRLLWTRKIKFCDHKRGGISTRSERVSVNSVNFRFMTTYFKTFHSRLKLKFISPLRRKFRKWVFPLSVVFGHGGWVLLWSPSQRNDFTLFLNLKNVVAKKIRQRQGNFTS